MPDEILTAREIMLYIGIPTINCTKDMKQIFYNTALNFSYYNLTSLYKWFGYYLSAKIVDVFFKTFNPECVDLHYLT